MKTLKKHWGRLLLMTGLGLALLTLLTTGLLWGQTVPGLGITVTSSNLVSLTVTNGTSNGLYQIYFTEFLDPANADWTLFTNGATGQTNFAAAVGDLEQGFFKAVNNTNFIPPSITIIIQSPANGSLVY